MGQVKSGAVSADQAIAAAADAGYDLSSIAPQLQALAG
jgi:translation initiation factor IF-3